MPKYSRAKKFGKLAAFTQELEQALKADAQRHKRDQRTGRALFAQIKASGYAGGYTRVTDFNPAVQEALRAEAAQRRSAPLQGLPHLCQTEIHRG